MVGCVYESFVPGEDCRGMGLRAKIKVCGAHSRSVKCIALLSSRGPRKSAMDSGGIRRLNLPLRPKAMLSPGEQLRGQEPVSPVRRPAAAECFTR